MDEPPPVPGTNGTKWRFCCGIQERKASLSQGRVSFCPREGAHLSQERFLFVPDTVPPKMFMFIGLFLTRTKGVVRQRAPLRTALRRFLKLLSRRFSEGFLEAVLAVVLRGEEGF